MKKRILLYVFTAFSALLLQSCVTNYVVSKPTTYTDDNKLNAKFISQNISKDNKALEASLARLDNFTHSENTVKNEELANVLKRSKTIDGVLSEAETYLGTPYRFGGITRRGIDCSGFVLSVYGIAAGIDLPRVAASQSKEGEKVERENLQKGDLIFFSHGRGRISHVGIVYEITQDGDVKFIHAATSKGVSISSLSDSYWASKFRFAKRIITEDGLEESSSPETSLASKKTTQVVVE